jgi:hypothetical protein
METAMRYLLLLMVLLVTPAWAVPYLIGDVSVPDTVADRCTFTPVAPSTGPEVTSAVVVDNVRGVAGSGFRVCRLDLASVPVGAFSFDVALSQSAWGTPGPKANFASTRPSLPPAVGNTRIVQ